MNHRIVSRVVVLITGLFVAIAALFAWIATVQAPADRVAVAVDIPHPPGRRTENCGECHTAEAGTAPPTHRYFKQATCPTCHLPSKRILVPHSIAMGDVRCPVCHSDPARDYGMPVNHLRYETGECLLCHPVDPIRDTRRPEPVGLSRVPAPVITHPTTGVFTECTSCHEMEGRRPLPENHAMFAGETCEDCHEPGAEEGSE